jgi:hypothetical protein
MTRKDLAALRRCIEVAERDPMRREQVRHMRPRLAKALFCCSVAQSESLDLNPWECPPSESEPDDSDNANYVEQRRRARQLADRLRAAGLSIYEPDPIAVLEETAARARNETKDGSDDQIIHDTR